MKKQRNTDAFFTRTHAYSSGKPIFNYMFLAIDAGYASRTTLKKHGIDLAADRQPDAYALSWQGPLLRDESGKLRRSFVGYYKVDAANYKLFWFWCLSMRLPSPYR